jgi:aminopeptidase N
VTSSAAVARRVVTAAVVALALAIPAVAEARGGVARQDCGPGAAGIGDAYYPTHGNGGYDARHYDLDVPYDPSTDVLNGTATVRAKATQCLTSFNLDLVGLTVERVRVDGRPARWSREGQELTVTPARRIVEDQRFRVKVTYSGVPVEFTIPGTDIRTGFMAVADGATVLGQPEVAAAWYPVNDHPLDKASYNFEVSVPTGYEVVANGSLRDRDRSGGWTTWEWDAPEPMASYRATIDIGYWDVTRGRIGRLPVYDAVDSAVTGDVRAAIHSSLSRQDEVLDLLTDAFGPYPFSTVGGIVEGQDDLRFALETQTRPVYSKLFWLDSEGNVENGDFVVVHELAHQWFGDDVALARWQDIWLNEGFASYAEWLWEEYEGRATPQEIFEATYEQYPADDPFWSVVIGDPGVDLLRHKRHSY